MIAVDDDTEQLKNAEEEAQDIIDEGKMEEIKTVLQSQIVSADEDEEVSLQFLEEIMANSAAQRDQSKDDVYTPTFAEDEVD